jgi:hypothetical protein
MTEGTTECAGRRPILTMATQSLSTIEEILWPNGEKRDLWMIVDAARDRTIFRMLLECGLEYSCLYAGALPPALEIAAPYLVQLEYQDRSTRRFLERAGGNSWGIFLKCDLRLDKLRRHLRHFLIVRGPRGNRLVFRYYDPRVLRVYLPTCNAEELNAVFGPIHCFWTEDQTPGNMLEFHFDGGRLVQRTLSLAPGAAQRGLPLGPQREDIRRIDAPRRPGILAMRQAQLAAFSHAEVQKFEVRMIAHLRRFFPKQCAALTEPQLRELIQHGIKRAADHKITSERDVCKFIDLTIVFGRDFDADKKLPWASRILKNRNAAASRIQSLYQAAQPHLGRS